MRARSRAGRPRRARRRPRLLAALAGLALALSLGSCIRVEHLGEYTGEAFEQVFRVQRQGGKVDHKPMEGEMARVAVEAMTEPDKAASRSGLKPSYQTMVRLGE